ncbi:MAG: hypothetical protein U0R23_05540 [Candidatus Nanopelagicales bacterium]
MTVHSVDVGHDALADYALLFAEACEVLSDLAHTPAGSRADDYEALQSIHAEGADLHSGVIVPDGLPELHALPAALRDMFADVMLIGERMQQSQPVPPVEDLLLVEEIADAVSTAMENLEDTELVGDQATRIADRAQRLSAAPPYPADTPLGRLLSAVSAARSGLEILVTGIPAA